MTDIEQKALALLNEVSDERGYLNPTPFNRYLYTNHEALCRAIEQHEATKQELSDFRQEVSDIVSAYVHATSEDDWEKLKTLIIPAPKPDPLVEVLRENFNIAADQMEADKFRATLCAFGLEIREKNDAG